METLWFCLVSLMLTGYVVFDGFDLGAGVVHLVTGKNTTDKRSIIRSIGPVWDGNEVWLLSAAATLYFAFPAVYARGFSGFYLPMMMLLWLLIARAGAVELRGHLGDPLWVAFWDRVFGLSSLLLAFFFGVALGNILRGVPMDMDQKFFEPLWTNFRTTGQTGVLDWFTILVGLAAVATLTVHGGLWVALKTEGDVQRRARDLAGRAWMAVGALIALLSVAMYLVQPQLRVNLAARPWGAIFPLTALVGFVLVRRFVGRHDDLRAFLGSCTFIVGMMASAVFAIFPYLLPSNGDPALGLTAFDTATSAYGMKMGLLWWIPGMVLVTIYFRMVYTHFGGKVSMEDGEG